MLKSQKISPRTFQKKKESLKNGSKQSSQISKKQKKSLKTRFFRVTLCKKLKEIFYFHKNPLKKKNQSLSEDEFMRHRLTLSSESNTSSANHFKNLK